MATKSARRRAIRIAAERAAEQLGNTPAVARRSYVDPRVVDRFEAGETIAVTTATPSDERALHKAERAVLRLLGE